MTADSGLIAVTLLPFMSCTVADVKLMNVFETLVASRVRRLISFKSNSPSDITTMGSSSENVRLNSGSLPGFNRLLSSAILTCSTLKMPLPLAPLDDPNSTLNKPLPLPEPDTPTDIPSSPTVLSTFCSVISPTCRLEVSTVSSNVKISQPRLRSRSKERRKGALKSAK